MKTYYAIGKGEFSRMNTQELRENLLIQQIFTQDSLNLYYSHYDRIIVGGAMPIKDSIALAGEQELLAEYFLERREAGVINIGGEGKIVADGTSYKMAHFDCIYLPKGTKEIVFSSLDATNPALFYINSTPAHKECKLVHIPFEKAIKASLGSDSECNKRVINKYIVPETVQTCQLTMGLTILEDGSVWNTMPTHTHERRMEVYLYFDIAEDNVVFHLMGEPNETRHLVIQDKQAVISPSWSIHSGVGTKNYTFIWGMCGENQDFSDMQAVATTDLR